MYSTDELCATLQRHPVLRLGEHDYQLPVGLRHLPGSWLHGSPERTGHQGRGSVRLILALIIHIYAIGFIHLRTATCLCRTGSSVHCLPEGCGAAALRSLLVGPLLRLPPHAWT